MVGKLYWLSSAEPFPPPRTGTVPYVALPEVYAELMDVIEGVRECIPERLLEAWLLVES